MLYIIFFFFQAEDGIRDLTVTGVQTCALPIYQEDVQPPHRRTDGRADQDGDRLRVQARRADDDGDQRASPDRRDRKSTRLNSSHSQISYAVFCLKKKIAVPICILTSTGFAFRD